MNSTRKPLRDRLSISWTAHTIALLIGLFIVPSVGSAQVRTKKPDRGVYQPPRLTDVAVEAVSGGQSRPAEAGIKDMVRSREPSESAPRQRRPLVEVALEEKPSTTTERVERISARDPDEDPMPLRQVDHQEVAFAPPVVGTETIIPSAEPWSEEPVIWDSGNVIHDQTCDGCSSCDGCDSMGCDSMGCDSMGCYSAPWYGKWSNASLSCCPDRWFGSVELLLMWRKGDRLPPLVTSTTDPAPDPETAGELGQPNTVVLLGNQRVLRDLTAGGRFTIGTWIDDRQCRSLVLRGWLAGEETFGFGTTQDRTPIIARPFTNVSDGQAAAQDTQLIAFPDRSTGSVRVHASSDVFGGDLSVRQFLHGQYGGTVDVLYGYQYMRLNESLGISSLSTSLDDDVAPIGAVLSVADSFKTRNEFHGGQVGLASHYREKCWSFNALLKVGFGSLRRRAKLAGSTFTSVDGANAIDPNGLLVRSTNSGAFTDHTFGWVPELDLSLGWQQYPRFDVTVGYHIIAMTDALQVSGAIDPNLAVNLSDPPTGQQRPAAILRYDTYYVQGIHFGLQHVY